jgi:hypothetical protein
MMGFGAIAMVGVATIAAPVASGPSGSSADSAPVQRSEAELHSIQVLAEAKAAMQAVQGLVVDYQSNGAPTQYFDREGEITLRRPASFSIYTISGMIAEKRKMVAVSDGTTVTRMDEHDFLAYRKPVRSINFFMGQNFLVQYFFDPRPITFDPTDPTWGQSVSLFDKNRQAYDRDVTYTYMGHRTLEDATYEVVEIKYNVPGTDIRQQIYVGKDHLVYQVDTYYGGRLYSEKFRNFRIDPVLGPESFQLRKEEKMPIIETDPVRLGEVAPDFTLPDYKGHGDLSLKELIKDKKGAFIAVLDGTTGKKMHNADALLGTMRYIQLIKDRFEQQGLMVICIVGSPEITPDLVSEMKLNWMPDVSRFNYPIAVDVDVERGIQGAAFENFQLGGRRTLLLDKDGKVVFGSYGFGGTDVGAFLQAMGQIGFTVSPADIQALH